MNRQLVKTYKNYVFPKKRAAKREGQINSSLRWYMHTITSHNSIAYSAYGKKFIVRAPYISIEMIKILL